MPYQRQNPNQCETYTNQATSLLPNYQSNIEQNTNTAPILQRLFQAQQRQQYIILFIYTNKFHLSFVYRNEQRHIDIGNQQSFPPYENNPILSSEHYQKGLSAFYTPVSPQQSNTNNTFAWPFSTSQNQKVFFIFSAFSSPFSFELACNTSIAYTNVNSHYCQTKSSNTLFS
jgi:hypothetical protein